MADKSPEDKQRWLMIWGPRATFFLGALILTVYVLQPAMITVDIWTISLLIVLGLIPFVSDIKEVYFSKDKVAITKSTERLRDQVESSKKGALEALKKRVKEIEDSEDGKEVEDKVEGEIHDTASRIRDVAEDEPKLAFMELMRIIERELREILKNEKLDAEGGLAQLTQIARENELLSRETIYNLEDIRPLRNQVFHGERVDQSNIENMIDVGLNLLETLKYEKETEELTEAAIMSLLEENPSYIEEGLEIEERQPSLGPTERPDFIATDREGRKTIVEVKSRKINENALKQVSEYIRTLEELEEEKIRAILVGPQVEERIKPISSGEIKLVELDLSKLRRSYNS